MEASRQQIICPTRSQSSRASNCKSTIWPPRCLVAGKSTIVHRPTRIGITLKHGRPILRNMTMCTQAMPGNVTNAYSQWFLQAPFTRSKKPPPSLEKPSTASATRFWPFLHGRVKQATRSEEHTSELQSRGHLVCRLLLEKKKETHDTI